MRSNRRSNGSDLGTVLRKRKVGLNAMFSAKLDRRVRGVDRVNLLMRDVFVQQADQASPPAAIVEHRGVLDRVPRDRLVAGDERPHERCRLPEQGYPMISGPGVLDGVRRHRWEERLQVWELRRHVEQQISEGVQRNIAEQARHLARRNCRDPPIDDAIFLIEQRDSHRLAPALYHTVPRAEGARYRDELDAVAPSSSS